MAKGLDISQNSDINGESANARGCIEYRWLDLGNDPMKEKALKMVITVDGPAGSGKSTVSRFIAQRLGILYLDTGAMYRAVALHVNRGEISVQDKGELKKQCQGLDLRFVRDGTESRLYSGEEDISRAIRSSEIDMLSSKVSALKEVREAMTELQRKIGSDGRLVAEGRDMGTVVFPDADLKFFVTASPEQRSLRRYRERLEGDETVSLKEVEKDLIKRDDQDTKRAIAPLRPAEDAMIVDTSEMDANQVVDVMLCAVGAKFPGVFVGD